MGEWGAQVNAPSVTLTLTLPHGPVSRTQFPWCSCAYILNYFVWKNLPNPTSCC